MNQNGTSRTYKRIKIQTCQLDAQIAQVDTQIAQARMQGNLAENEVENQLIRAPFDGIVFAKSADTGSIVNAGTQSFLLLQI